MEPGTEKTGRGGGGAEEGRRTAIGRVKEAVSRGWRSARSGRNAKAPYYVKCAAASLVPGAFWRWRREGLLAALERHPRREDLYGRIGYACRLEAGARVETGEAGGGPYAVGQERFPRRKHTYFYDARTVLRYFPEGLRYQLVPGDVTWVPEAPAFVKSRPIAEGGANANSVLLRLNQIRHFVRVRDPYTWEEKDGTAFFRGTVHLKPKRERLFERYFGAPGFDLGDTSRKATREEWRAAPQPIAAQLRHRYILCIEGNDVASCLKWVFASNSIAVMPRPEYETWFEEGRLEAGVHYVEVRKDYGDLPERLAECAARPEWCAAINRAEQEWAARFADARTELLVGLGVARRYFEATGQLPRKDEERT